MKYGVIVAFYNNRLTILSCHVMMSDHTDDSTEINSSYLNFVKRLPKVELHAHLNGCIRETTLFELAKERSVALKEHHFLDSQERHTTDGDYNENSDVDELSMYNLRPRSLKDCFDIFIEISKCVDDVPALERITMEALNDFAEEHVAYLELRSTPKCLLEKSGGTKRISKHTYCTTILDCMMRFQSAETARFVAESSNVGGDLPRLPMTCRFIVSVDRSQSIEDAYEHVRLAKKLREEFNDLVVGVDLGGNPTKVRCLHEMLFFFINAPRSQKDL